eukprot:4444004-Amphidinium_carterae.1
MAISNNTMRDKEQRTQTVPKPQNQMEQQKRRRAGKLRIARNGDTQWWPRFGQSVEKRPLLSSTPEFVVPGLSCFLEERGLAFVKATYCYLTPDLWKQTAFVKSPYQE